MNSTWKRAPRIIINSTCRYSSQLKWIKIQINQEPLKNSSHRAIFQTSFSNQSACDAVPAPRASPGRTKRGLIWRRIPHGMPRDSDRDVHTTWCAAAGDINLQKRQKQTPAPHETIGSLSRSGFLGGVRHPVFQANMGWGQDAQKKLLIHAN